MVFAQYIRHPESKSLAPDGTLCKDNTCGLLARYPVTALSFNFVGKETERGWEQSEDISTLLPSLVRYQGSGMPREQLPERLLRIPLSVLQKRTGLSKHTILRAKRGRSLRAKSLAILSEGSRHVE